MNLHKPDPHLLLYLLQTYEFPAYNGIYNHLFKNGEQYSDLIIEITYMQSIKLRLQDFMNGSSQGRIQEYSKVYELLTLAKRAIFSLATLCKCSRPFKSARTPFAPYL